MKRDDNIIPGWEWGLGAVVDWKNDTLYGVSGMIYRNVQVNKKDLDRIIEETRKKLEN